MPGILHATFKSASIPLGLVKADEEWAGYCEKAEHFSWGRSLGIVFTTALLFGDITQPLHLRNGFSASICDDL